MMTIASSVDFHFCKALLKTGNRKGQPCGAMTLTDYCKRHGKNDSK